MTVGVVADVATVVDGGADNVVAGGAFSADFATVIKDHAVVIVAAVTHSTYTFPTAHGVIQNYAVAVASGVIDVVDVVAVVVVSHQEFIH